MKKNAFITTFTGKSFYPFKPSVNEIDIVDIAHALSHQCRFGGHSKKYYSVAQHSILVSLLSKDALGGLLHDSPEAYIIDCPSPIKHNIPQLIKLEDNIFKCIAKKFGLKNQISKDIHSVDKLIFEIEWSYLMENNTNKFYELSERYSPLIENGYDPDIFFEYMITHKKPETIKALFLERFHDIVNKNNEKINEKDKKIAITM